MLHPLIQMGERGALRSLSQAIELGKVPSSVLVEESLKQRLLALGEPQEYRLKNTAMDHLAHTTDQDIKRAEGR